MTMRILLSTALAACCVLGAGCGSGGSVESYAKVTAIHVFPASPQLDRYVSIRVEDESNLAYPGFGNSGSNATYSVSAGEQVSWEYGPAMEFLDVLRPTITCHHSQVTWHTPAAPGEVTIEAHGFSGGKTLSVQVQPSAS